MLIIGCNDDNTNDDLIDNNEGLHRFVGVWNLEQYNLITLGDSILSEATFEATLDIRNNGVFDRNDLIGNFYWVESLEEDALLITSEFDANDGTYFTTTKRYDIEIDEKDIQFWRNEYKFIEFNTNELYRSIEEWRLERQ